ncbi:uncharacterized protein FIBRA_01950 [Fibroporia radiculosa]|uniref:Zinc finger C3HC4 RING-type domain-containing protein n=1 Tax=Fibroporia radiculosa TaxID=599839 RepID=J4GLY2_9APHY|nr:uncharacterized protein FIBRA_01950 [Fibroporia radiculosa]CCL99925.1 predicted protein [Fibroporia radiculosa]
MEVGHAPDLTPDMPLPAPTTITIRSLRPCRSRGPSAHSNSISRSATASSSQSRANSVGPSSMALSDEADPGLMTAVHADADSARSAGEASLEQQPMDMVWEPDDGPIERPRKRRRVDDQHYCSAYDESAPDAPPLFTALPSIRSSSGSAEDDMEPTFVEAELGGGSVIGQGSSHAGVSSENSGSTAILSDVPSGCDTPGKTSLTVMAPVAGPSHVRNTADEAKEKSSSVVDQNDGPIDVDALPDSLYPLPSRGRGKRRAESLVADDEPSQHASSSKEPLKTSACEQATCGDEPLSEYTCPICFTPPMRATLTPCGHICCGECLFTAVKTTIQRNMYTVPASERIAR